MKGLAFDGPLWVLTFHSHHLSCSACVLPPLFLMLERFTAATVYLVAPLVRMGNNDGHPACLQPCATPNKVENELSFCPGPAFQELLCVPNFLLPCHVGAKIRFGASEGCLSLGACWGLSCSPWCQNSSSPCLAGPTLLGWAAFQAVLLPGS